MKKTLYFFVCALIFALLFSLISCGGTDVDAFSASINDAGELILVYPDGTEENLGVVVGKDGKNGKDGENGKDGKDGKDGEDGKDGLNGKDGKDGLNGKDGEDGKDGATVITSDYGIGAACAKGLRSAVSIVSNFTAAYPNYQTGENQYASAGSGVIYQMDKSSGDAFIITNYHVVYDSKSNTKNGISADIDVYLYGSENSDKAIKASYVGGSINYDIAVLKIDNSELLRQSDAVCASLADADAVRVGNTAIAIGNAKGYGISASIGIVSVDSEYIKMLGADEKTEVTFRVMRIDTAVNPGNSGGGLYDDKGQLIGIVNAKNIEDNVENIGYAIPASVVAGVADNIIYYCNGTDEESVHRAILGITVMSNGSKAVYDASTGLYSIVESICVYEVTSGTIADGALMPNDVLLSATLNGKTVEISRQHHLIDLMLTARVGDSLLIKVLREGAEAPVELIISEDCITEY